MRLPFAEIVFFENAWQISEATNVIRLHEPNCWDKVQGKEGLSPAVLLSCSLPEQHIAYLMFDYLLQGQLFKLMNTLENTSPHFIRCIKPNSKQLSRVYEEDLVLQQLRCCGVLEVVRISRSGYPTRLTHQEFAGRYGFLLSDKRLSQDPLSVSIAVLKQYDVHPEMYQVGYTKLYLRTGQVSHSLRRDINAVSWPFRDTILMPSSSIFLDRLVSLKIEEKKFFKA